MDGGGLCLILGVDSLINVIVVAFVFIVIQNRQEVTNERYLIRARQNNV